MQIRSLAMVLIALFLFAGAATAAPPEFGRPVFVVVPAPQFSKFASGSKFNPGPPACFNCTVCGPSCPCPAGACAVGGCPVPSAAPVQYQVCENGQCKIVGSNPSSYTTGAPSAYNQAPNFTTPSGSCAGGQCQPAARTGWYPGKRLGR